MIDDLEGIPSCEQRLMFGDMELVDDYSLEDYDIAHLARLQVEQM